MENRLEQVIYHELKEVSTEGEDMSLLKSFQRAFPGFAIINPRSMAERIVSMLERIALAEKARGEKLDGFSEET